MCGGTAAKSHLNRRANGLSPRVRGNRRSVAHAAAVARSIPACAGEPVAQNGGGGVGQVYPRVCGGTKTAAAPRSLPRGLSPRVRGNPDLAAAGTLGTGSIPACAGEPLRRLRHAAAPQVYPRVCGGTIPVVPSRHYAEGLSPRVRGNRICKPGVALNGRSIPACAGEPRGGRLPGPGVGVYPRVCGGTSCPKAPKCLLAWSIPACAGEPRRSAPRPPLWRVYPRVCGGTTAARAAIAQRAGLSPRVRGNQGLADAA